MRPAALSADHRVPVVRDPRINLGTGRGRYLASTEEEYREFRTHYLKPLRARAKVIKLMDKAALLKFPNMLQPPLFDLDELTEVLE